MMKAKHNVLINLKNITFNYPAGTPLLDKLNFSLSKGERIGLIGSNGCGKTTLFHIIMGLLKPLGGEMEIFSKPRTNEPDFQEVREKIGLLFQDADDQLFCPTVEEDVAFGPLNLRKSHDETKIIVKETLENLGLTGFARKVTYHLSGGEKKLVSLATVLAMKPEVLLLDEPTTVLDDSTTERIGKILNNSDMSYAIISHDLAFLKKTTKYLYRLNQGQIQKV